MTLRKESLEWSIDFVRDYSDGDRFPRVLEIDADSDDRDDFIESIQKTDLSSQPLGSDRRFIVPKDDLSSVTVDAPPLRRGGLRGCDGGGWWRFVVLDRARRGCFEAPEVRQEWADGGGVGGKHHW